MKKDRNFPPTILVESSRGRTVFQSNNVRDQDSDHALFAELGSSPASMEAAKLLDAFFSVQRLHGFRQVVQHVQLYVTN